MATVEKSPFEGKTKAPSYSKVVIEDSTKIYAAKNDKIMMKLKIHPS